MIELRAFKLIANILMGIIGLATFYGLLNSIVWLKQFAIQQAVINLPECNVVWKHGWEKKQRRFDVACLYYLFIKCFFK